MLLVVAISLVACGTAQKKTDDGVPAVVKEKFSAMYPKVSTVKWDQEDNNYEAEFKSDDIETSVLFDATGKVLETEVAVDPKTLPEATLVYCKDSLGGEKIKEAAKITDAGGVVTYEAEIGKVDYIFDANGEFVKKITDQESDSEDQD